jgi:hypothetical protein
MPGQNIKINWICSKGHEQEKLLNNRVTEHKNGHGCPTCSNHRVSIENCLATKFPEIAKQWDHERNGELTPFDIIAKSSTREIHWICEKNHKVIATPYYRIVHGCSECSSLNIENCLATKFPEIAKQWDHERNGELTPYTVFPAGAQKINWVCEKGHTWSASLCNRTSAGTKCPICSNRSNHKICIENCLATKFPEIAKQWDHERNGELTPFDVAPGTKTKIHWICEKGHRWITSGNQRTASGRPQSGCPDCRYKGQTKCVEMSSYFFSFIFSERVEFLSCSTKFLGGMLKFDGYSKKKYLAVEYDGSQHYDPEHWVNKKDTQNFVRIQERDARKNILSRKNNVLVIRIKDIPYLYLKVQEFETYIISELIKALKTEQNQWWWDHVTKNKPAMKTRLLSKIEEWEASALFYGALPLPP